MDCLKFENLVLQHLIRLDNSFNNLSLFSKKLGVAVSGGADSVCLLVSLLNILKPYGIPLKVITVNHFIRPKEETCGDVDFVLQLCNNFKAKGFCVDCSAYDLEEGAVEHLSKSNKIGIEAAARTLRYEAFEKFISDNSLDYVCLAHNKNDQLESLLMNFLKGSGLDSLSGIAEKRGHFIRPLLNISRDQIEDYLKNKNIDFRTDKTNFDTNYFRNKVRNILVPTLNENFPGWQSGVITGQNKYYKDSEFIRSKVNKLEDNLYKFDSEKNVVVINKNQFIELDSALKYRILAKTCNLISSENRIPIVFFEDVISSLQSDKNKQNTCEKRYNNIVIIIKKSEVFIKKAVKKYMDLVFFDIIKEEGNYEYPFGSLVVHKINTREAEIEKFSLTFNDLQLEQDFTLPLCIRNVKNGDVIKTQKGEYKKLSDIFTDWHVDEESKKLIPLIQELETEKQEVLAICGQFLGYKNWIVKN